MPTKQSILLPGGGDIDPICLPRGGALAQFFFPWGGDIAIFFPEMANSRRWPGGGAPLELTEHYKLESIIKHQAPKIDRTRFGNATRIFNFQ